MRRALLACVLAAACGGGASQVRPAPPAPVTLALGEAHERYQLVLGGARASAELTARPAGGGEVLATLTLTEVDDPTGASPLAGLTGVSFRWRMSARGEITAAAGPSGPPGMTPERLGLALELWPLIDASVPRLPAGPVAEGATWRADSRTEVVGGGRERVVEIHADWRLAKIFSLPPPTVVMEGSLEVAVRDPAKVGEPATIFKARVAIYLNLERHAVDFVTVSSDALAWEARRL